MAYPFKLKELKKELNYLEPFIDAKTVETHYGKHVQTYVDNLNKLLVEQKAFHKMTIEEVIANAQDLPENIRQGVLNNAGGVINHYFYFDGMTTGGAPLKKGAFLTAIEAHFGSFDEFKTKFKAEALTVFGSGYLLLALDENNNLVTKKLANQQTHIEFNLKPLIILDVWEHAYYIKCQNRRAEYIDNWFNVVDFAKADKLYKKYVGKILNSYII